MNTRGFAFSIAESERLVTVPLSGSVRGEQLAATLTEIYLDARYRPGFDIIWDGSAITELLFEADDLPSLLRVNRAFQGLSKAGRDIIVAVRPIDRSMAKMYAAMMKPHGRVVHVCESMDEARYVLDARAGRR